MYFGKRKFLSTKKKKKKKDKKPFVSYFKITLSVLIILEPIDPGLWLAFLPTRDASLRSIHAIACLSMQTKTLKPSVGRQGEGRCQ